MENAAALQQTCGFDEVNGERQRLPVPGRGNRRGKGASWAPLSLKNKALARRDLRQVCLPLPETRGHRRGDNNSTLMIHILHSHRYPRCLVVKHKQHLVLLPGLRSQDRGCVLAGAVWDAGVSPEGKGYRGKTAEKGGGPGVLSWKRTSWFSFVSHCIAFLHCPPASKKLTQCCTGTGRH